MASEIKLYWDPVREDNFTPGSVAGEADALAARYSFMRIEGYALDTPLKGTVPLKLYWNEQRGDNFTTATEEGQQSALDAGYVYIRDEGYVFPDQKSGTVPLKLYWSGEREDNFTTATAEGQQSALDTGYKYIRDEGYVYAGPPAVGDISFSFNWAGAVLTLSHKLTQDVIQTANDVTAIKDIILDVAKGVGQVISPQISIAITVAAGYIDLQKTLIKIMDKGNGVYLTLPYPAIYLQQWFLIIPTSR